MAERRVALALDLDRPEPRWREVALGVGRFARACGIRGARRLAVAFRVGEHLTPERYRAIFRRHGCPTPPPAP